MVMMSRRTTLLFVAGLALVALTLGGCRHHSGHARAERTVYYDDGPGYYGGHHRPRGGYYSETTVYGYDTFGYSPGYRGYSGRRTYRSEPERVVVVEQERPRARIEREREQRVYGNSRSPSYSPPRTSSPPRSSRSTGDRGDRYSRDTSRGGGSSDRQRTRDR